MKKLILAGLVALLATDWVMAQQDVARIAYADADYIISQLPETRAMEEQVKATQAKLESDYQAKSGQFQKDYTSYVEGMTNMPDTVRAKREAQLQQASMELQQMEANAQRTIHNQQKLLLAPIYLRVNSAINIVAAENGYDMVLSRRVKGIDLFLYAAEGKDISSLVIERLKPETK